MAEAKKKRRVVKKVETVREQATKAQTTVEKPRRVRRVTSKVSKPLRAAGRRVKKTVAPLSFLLWPFRTRPARFVGRILYKVFLIQYFRDSWGELRLVTWPDRRQTLSLTLAVFIFAIIFALIVSVVDFGLDKVFKQLLLS